MKHTISNNLLYELITYGDGLKEELKVGVGNWNKGEPLACGVLTHLVAQVFGVYRFPWQGDRVFSKVPYNLKDDQRAVLQNATTLNEAAESLRELYSAVQIELAKTGRLKLRLHRSLLDYDEMSIYGRDNTGYATLLMHLDAAARKMGRTHFWLEMDVLNSWSLADSHYGMRQVTVGLDINIEDVVWVAAMVDTRSKESAAAENGEWVVLNRAPDGLVRLPVGQITSSQERFDEAEKWVNDKRTEELIDFLDHWRHQYRIEGHVRLSKTLPRYRTTTFTERLKNAYSAFRYD